MAAVVAVAIATPSHFALWQRAIIGWDAGAATLVGLAWFVIERTDSAGTKARASGDDPGRHLVFVVGLAASLFSLFAAAFALRQVKALAAGEQLGWMLATIASIALSWTMTHTSYALRYAHLYYRDEAGERSLAFPGDEDPADIDFAYFAFTVGMCFQVSDVEVCTRAARRAVLLHSVLSFVYNTMIVALALNLVVGSMS
ncbi:MAG: putative transrane protein [Labilithrix sp.]|nr:putative transrane protein [Labilithrix sp.]